MNRATLELHDSCKVAGLLPGNPQADVALALTAVPGKGYAT